MPDKTRPSDDDAPNRASAMEKAEGSRDNGDDAGTTHQQGAGITNRPIEQEKQEQDSLPPRGKSKDGSHA